ncbi:MAG TPA: hypothetical protein VGH40_02160 [Roseiarcus sp.]|jgi:hypothetical protein
MPSTPQWPLFHDVPSDELIDDVVEIVADAVRLRENPQSPGRIKV